MTKDYRQTIFLPKTDFPMRGQLSKKEPEILENWYRIGLYQKTQDKGDKLFVLHDGPPYANGNIHLGTALNKIMKDTINRFHTKMGYRVPYVPGWDCHGLPIETKVEERFRKEGRNKDEVSPIEFRKECREFAKQWIDIQREEFKRLGVIGDWDNPYLTMTNEAEAEIVRLLGEFLMNGSLYRGVKPVMWSVVEKTALAEAEVEYKDHESDSIYVAFPIVKSKAGELDGVEAVIWTTTPWTIPANRAIAYGEDLEYVVLDTGSAKYLVAKDLQDKFVEANGFVEVNVVKNLKGSDLEGAVCHHPLNGDGYDFPVPMLPGDHVTTEAGTGLVHTAPSHGLEDFELGKKFGLEVPELVGDDGVYHQHVPLFAGKHVYKVNGEVMEALKAKGKLLSSTKLVHSYPHSWRSKKPLIYRTTPQWFISMSNTGLKDKALDSIKKTKWIPSQSINRITAMVENRPDWCVSRQRSWGVPITIFVHKETGQPLKDRAVFDRIVSAVKEGSSDVWYTTDPQVFLGDDYRAEDYVQVTDILDVWFDSGATHSFVLKARSDLKWPADLYLEGSDQHRGWFQTSLLVGCGIYGEAPYKTVLTHGFVVDEQGRKMSKSQGNVIAPQVLADTMGIDILRLFVMSSDTTDDLRIGPQLLEKQQDIYRRYRNTLRYLLGAIGGAPKNVEYDSLPELEKWVLHRLYELDSKVRKANENYTFQDLYSEIHNFCSVDLSAFYLDIRKDSLYCDDLESSTRKAAVWVMDQVFECLVHWLAPVLCFTAEEAWQEKHKNLDDSVHLHDFPEIPVSYRCDELAEKFDKLRDIRGVITTAIEREREKKVIGSSLAAKVVVYTKSKEHLDLMRSIDMDEFTITSVLDVVEADRPDGAVSIDSLPGLGVVVSAAEGQKCARCWKVLPEVGTLSDPDVCSRCEEAVKSSYAA